MRLDKAAVSCGRAETFKTSVEISSLWCLLVLVACEQYFHTAISASYLLLAPSDILHKIETSE